MSTEPDPSRDPKTERAATDPISVSAGAEPPSRYQPGYAPRQFDPTSASAAFPGLHPTRLDHDAPLNDQTISRHRGEVWGDFELGPVIGRGGMGVVYRARQISLDRQVAVKVLPGHLSDEEDLIARFELEAKSVAMITSPHVIQVFTFGKQRNHRFFAMELLDGEDLGKKLRDGWRPDPTEVVALLTQAVQGLIAAHERGIVHRDLKPSNLMLSSQGVLKVMDFGLARLAHATHSRTTTGQIKGTGWYMSPEQCRGLTCDARSDIYSIGVVFYELLTRHRPFYGETFMELMRKHNEDTPIPPREIDPRVSEAQQAVVYKCLAKKPEDRYQSAHELLAELERLRTGQVTIAERERPIPRPPHLTMAVVATVLVAIAVATAWLLPRSSSATRPHPLTLPPGNHAPALADRTVTMVATRAVETPTTVPPAQPTAPGPDVLLAAEPRPSTSAASAPPVEPPVADPPAQPAPTPSSPVITPIAPPPVIRPDPAYWQAWQARMDERFHELDALAARQTPCALETRAWLEFLRDLGDGNPLSEADERERARAEAALRQAQLADPGDQAPPWATRYDHDTFGRWAEIDRSGYVQRFRYCPPGAFICGSALNAPGHRLEELPHSVRLGSGFWMADSEATNRQWQALMGGDGNDGLPITAVSWHDAVAFCKALTALIGGQEVCLPSEAQWEYACRAGLASAPATLADFAWMRANAEALKPVKTKQANRWGLHDLLGNALEWCDDWYAPYPDAALSDPHGPKQGSDRVCRGGAFDCAEADCRPAARFHLKPETRFPNLGVRVIIPAAATTVSGNRP